MSLRDCVLFVYLCVYLSLSSSVNVLPDLSIFSFGIYKHLINLYTIALYHFVQNLKRIKVFTLVCISTRLQWVIHLSVLVYIWFSLSRSSCVSAFLFPFWNSYMGFFFFHITQHQVTGRWPISHLSNANFNRKLNERVSARARKLGIG